MATQSHSDSNRNRRHRYYAEHIDTAGASKEAVDEAKQVDPYRPCDFASHADAGNSSVIYVALL